MKGTIRRYPLATLVVATLAACSSSSSPTAAPAPAAAPPSAPAPSATPQAFSCHLAALKDDGSLCPRPAPRLQDYVKTAIETVQAQQPELFDFTDAKGDSVKVLDRHRYQTAVVAAINARGGVCAKDDNVEIALKVTNDFNEQYNIWTSSGYTRRSHITTCFPARF